MLVDGDDFNEPVADAARSILDGHIVLTRKLAAQNHFPSIDVLESEEPRARRHRRAAAARGRGRDVQRLEAAYREKEDLIMVGAYQRGSDPYADAAIAHRDQALAFLRQAPDETTLYGDTYAALTQLGATVGAAVGATMRKGA